MKFPISLPEYINIQSENFAIDLYKKREILVTIAGKDRLFYVEEIGWNDYRSDYINLYEANNEEEHYIILQPAEWWTGEGFTATYIAE